MKLAQFFQNFDYTDSPSGPGTNIYHDLNKWKSVHEWLKHRANKRKKKLEKLK